MTKKGWIIFATICVLIIGGLVAVSRQDKINVDNVDADSIIGPSEQNGMIGDHVYGNKDAKVRIIEYGDYQCPGCASAAPNLMQVAEKYKDKIAFVFRNYPLVSAHPNALAAAAVAEAAGKQSEEKFWQINKKLYEAQNTWKDLSGASRTDYFVGITKDLGGLDTEKIRADIEDPAIRKKINFDTALGKKKNVTGTPSIYVNGDQVSNWRVNDGKVIKDGSSASGTLVWSSAEDFEKYVVIPALSAAGVSVSE